MPQRCSCRFLAGQRISGPLRDRIDIHIELPRVGAVLRAVREALRRAHGRAPSTGSGHASSTIWERVEAARERQRVRFDGSERLTCNGDMGPAEIREVCLLDDGSSLG